MSDVAGAFKILIESQPQSALDGFGKIVDSVKKAKSIMGEFADATVFLNSGLDLVMKTVDAAPYVFDAVVGSAQKAGSAFLDLAARGGDFREQQVQFETFASNAPALTRTQLGDGKKPGTGADAEPVLTEADEATIQMMGLDRDAFIKSRKAEITRLAIA